MSLRQRDFIEKTLHRLAESMEQAARADRTMADAGFLQRFDPRGKLVGLLLLIIAASVSHRLAVTGGLFVLGLVLTLGSGSGVVRAMSRLWVGILLFTGIVVLPALFTTPGQAALQIPGLAWPVTDHGVQSALLLISRVETTATLAALLMLTTPWPHLLKALRVLRVPVVFVVILGMTYRYIFVLLEIARDFFEARRARLVGRLDGRQRRQMAAASAGALLSKSVQLSSEVYDAMQARGFRGAVYTLDEFRMKRLDWCLLATFAALAVIAMRLGT